MIWAKRLLAHQNHGHVGESVVGLADVVESWKRQIKECRDRVVIGKLKTNWSPREHLCFKAKLESQPYIIFGGPHHRRFVHPLDAAFLYLDLLS